MRIIAGIYRGRRLQSLPGTAVRPTSDRVRTALFNILGQWLEGKRVLDLYAGIGGVGLECASRGAAHVTMVEHAADAARCLKSNIALLDAGDRTRVVADDVFAACERLGAQGTTFDLIYADQPYRDAAPRTLLAHLARTGVAHADTIVIIEHAEWTDETTIAASGWERYRRSAYGKARLSFFSRTQPAATGAHEGTQEES
ncbi:16S rRNA (guanine(966)-N(2))-methyltransferase RsmD [bacterium]|nr:16S rRNA (guanine(966)-N(2))-methyltransferase RsmD [bacterium]